MGFFDIFKRNNTNANKFNEAFFKLIGSEGSSYDANAPSYIRQGFNINPIVYSVISQMATKTSSVPYSIKKIESKKQKTKRDNLIKATNYNLTPQQRVKKLLIESKAFSDEEMNMPLDKPNPLQSWNEFLELYKTFIKLIGNVYIYKLAPNEGANMGKVTAIYLLPSHLINIVLKQDANLLDSTESPIKEYKLISGSQFITFKESEITHIKYPNPNFDMDGSHLYGFAPIRAVLKNIESSNLALDLNIKTMKNGGAFGLIHSKGQTPLTSEQAKGLKDRLVEMDNDNSKLSKIAGVSAEIGFTRLSMTTDELKLFDYLKFDKQQIADCLSWEVVSEGRGDFGGTINQIRKQRVVDNIIPDLNLLQQAFNTDILPFFKGYENSELIFDYSELPEMQSDVNEMVTWIKASIETGLITRNEGRLFMNLTLSDNKSMDEITVNTDVLTLDQSLEDMPMLTNE
jgi:phage portal protein BeeE